MSFTLTEKQVECLHAVMDRAKALGIKCKVVTEDYGNTVVVALDGTNKDGKRLRGSIPITGEIMHGGIYLPPLDHSGPDGYANAVDAFAVDLKLVDFTRDGEERHPIPGED